MKINVIAGLEMVKYTQHKIHKVGNRDEIMIFKGNLSLWLNSLRDDNFNLLNLSEFDNWSKALWECVLYTFRV